MLPKSDRLNLKKDFKWVVSGKRIETPLFTLFAKEGENDHCLVGIALSSKNFKKAHERNRARRLLSVALKQVYPQLRNNLNLVIMPKVAILLSPSEKTLATLENVSAIYSTN